MTPEQILLLADYLAQIAQALVGVRESYERAAWGRLRDTIGDLRLVAEGDAAALGRLRQGHKRAPEPSTPYVGFGNETLSKCPDAKAGDWIECPKCGGQHQLIDSEPPLLLFFKCGEKTYMAGVGGKLTMGRPADVKGRI